jgi:hypothetical protein
MRKLSFLVVLAALPLFCQQTKVQPDCTLGAVFTTTGNSSVFDNRAVQSVNSGPPCTLWALTWYAQSAVTSITINIEGAPDVAGVPGSFSSLANASTFPEGKLTYEASTSYYPWMRITVTATGAAGLIYAVLNGWREDQTSIGGGGGGGGGCPGTITTPCVIGGLNSSGAVVIPTYATANAAISLSSSGLTQLLALSGSTQIRVEHISVSFASAVNFQLEYGTGSNCGTGTTAVSGVYQAITGIALDFDSGTLNVPAGQALCANLGASVTGGGVLVYAQY